ncbi:4-coumarate--CoA ligase-like 1 isoform X3 [Harpegnathos saltator]|uniref:4-coumarate--CoA ligase-like 1 isoform X3 n=1 Tax=Harpegnathos saltator TaxID=610380 RepID=UPI000DBEDA13|nr:4-coumarate--CoA ligase-like 1 isoform X3 [Harpegnathos saltator]
MAEQRHFPFVIANDILVGKGPIDYEEPIINIAKLILNNLKSQPNFVAQVDATTGREITFQEIRNTTVKLALWMKSIDISTGDKIGISSEHYAILYVFIACLYIGAVPVLWHEKYDSDKAYTIASEVCGKLLFIDDVFAIANYDKLTQKRSKVIVFGTLEGFMSYNILKLKIDSRYNQKMVDGFICIEVDEYEDTAAVLYTRRTRLKKSVKIPHRYFNAPMSKQVFDTFPGKVGMWVGSFSLSINMLLAVYSILWPKRMIRFMGYTKEKVCQAIAKHKVDWVLLETQMCIEIANSDMLQKYDFSCLKRIIYSGAEIPYYNYTDLTLSLPNTIIVALYYTIETGIISYQSTNNKIKSSGHIGKNVMLKIIDIDTYDPVGPNVCGEICCYCVSMARTYIYNKTDHSLFSRDGWLHTNDTGYYDEDGEIFVMSRKIDFIMFRDYLYSPAIIENFISRYSTVDKVAVLGIMNAQGTKHPTAYILTKPEQHTQQPYSLRWMQN